MSNCPYDWKRAVHHQELPTDASALTVSSSMADERFFDAFCCDPLDLYNNWFPPQSQVRFQGEAWQRLQDEGVQLELDEAWSIHLNRGLCNHR